MSTLKIIFVFFISIISVISVRVEGQHAKQGGGRIVNGTVAESGQFPYQVSLRRTYNHKHFCAGSLVTPTIVLSAAHCMFIGRYGALILPYIVEVVAGEIKYIESEPNPNHRRRGKSIKIHEKFNRSTYENDIAILEVNSPFILSDTIQLIALTRKPNPKPGTMCFVSGWGYTAYNSSIMGTDLSFIEIPVINQKICEEKLGIVNGQFCAGYLSGEKDSCTGDSGGGLICNKRIVGIVSAGDGCAFPDFPGFYTDVGYYHDWISQKLIPKKYNEDKKFTIIRPFIEKMKNLKLVKKYNLK